MRNGFISLLFALAAAVTASFSFLSFVSIPDGGIESALAQLRLPSDVKYELSRFEDQNSLLTPFLKKAWEEAAEAQSLSKKVYEVELSFSLEGAADAVKAAFGLKVQEKKAQVLEKAASAYRAAWDSLSGVLHLAERSLVELASWGADNENYSGVAHENYEQARAAFDELGALFVNAAPKPANCEGVANRTACLLNDDKSADLSGKARIFNELVGRPGIALVDDYYALHVLLLASKAAMVEETEKQRQDFKEETKVFEERLKALEAENPEAVNSRALAALFKPDSVVLEAGSSGDFPSAFRKIKRDAQSSQLAFENAEWLFAGNSDDRVFRALERRQEALRLLEAATADAETLKQELKTLRLEAESLFKNAPASVLAFVDEAASEKSSGKALAKYGQAALVAKSNQSVLEYVEAAAKSLERFVDVGEEKREIAALQKVTPSPETAAAALVVEQKLRLKAHTFLSQVRELRQQAEELFNAAVALAQVFPHKFDELELSGTGDVLERLAVLDDFSNAGLLYEQYEKITKQLSVAVHRVAVEYLQSQVHAFVSFAQAPECEREANATLTFSVRNGLDVGLPAAFFALDLGAFKEQVSVPNLAAGGEYSHSRSLRVTPATCLVKTSVVSASELEKCVLVSVKTKAALVAEVAPEALVVRTEYGAFAVDWHGGDFSDEAVHCFSANASVQEQTVLQSLPKVEARIEPKTVLSKEGEKQPSFDAVAAYKKVLALKNLLAVFKTAVGTDEAFDAPTVSFSSANYDEAKAWLKRVEKIENESFFAEATALGSFLNESIASLKALAKTVVERAVSDAEAGKSREALLFAGKAKNAFVQGEYSKALQYSAQVPAPAQESPPWLFLAAALPLLGLAFFVLRRPKPQPQLQVVRTIDGGDVSD